MIREEGWPVGVSLLGYGGSHVLFPMWQFRRRGFPVLLELRDCCGWLGDVERCRVSWRSGPVTGFR